MCLGETDGPVVEGALPSDADGSHEASWAPACGLLPVPERTFLAGELSPGVAPRCVSSAPPAATQERIPRGILRSPHGLLGHLADLGQRPQFLNRDICPKRGWVPASMCLPLMDHVWTCGDVGQSNDPTFQNGGPSQPNCIPQGLSALHTCEIPSWTFANEVVFRNEVVQ